MRRHRWVATLVYDITAEDALRMTGLKAMKGAGAPDTQLAGDEVPATDDERPFLGLHNLVRELCAVACWECEVALTDARQATTECAGQPVGTLAYVDGSGRRTAEDAARPTVRSEGNAGVGFGAVGRNDPCPCGSGRKWKRCHGRGPGS